MRIHGRFGVNVGIFEEFRSGVFCLMEIFLIIFFIFCIAVLPHLWQWRMDYICSDFFRKIKIKKFWCFFTAMNTGFWWQKDNKRVVINDGIILPMLVLQILGYVLAGLITIILFVFLIMKMDLLFLGLVSGIILAIDVVVQIITIFITWRISRKREKLLDKIYKKDQ